MRGVYEQKKFYDPSKKPQGKAKMEEGKAKHGLEKKIMKPPTSQKTETIVPESKIESVGTKPAASATTTEQQLASNKMLIDMGDFQDLLGNTKQQASTLESLSDIAFGATSANAGSTNTVKANPSIAVTANSAPVFAASKKPADEIKKSEPSSDLQLLISQHIAEVIFLLLVLSIIII